MAHADQPVASARDVDVALLHAHPLPRHDCGTSKFERGQVLVVGGSAETPGGVLLAGIAALRVGAGRVHLATAASCAPALAIAVPEARVTALPEAAGGVLDPHGAELLDDELSRADAVVVGSGCVDRDATGALLTAVASRVGVATTLIIDAAALDAVRARPAVVRVAGGALLLPNRTEMAGLIGRSVESVEDDPLGALAAAVRASRVTVALRDARTWIADPSTGPYVDCSGSSALATSGSGDVLAGAVAGLAARGASPMTAVLWAVHAHGRSGKRLATRYGGLGLIARELLDVIGMELNDLAASAARLDVR
jgi:ADP-dependent NAD(P)H-hydrate dehydratase